MTEKRFRMDDVSDIIEFDYNTNEYIQDFMWADGKSWDRICNRLNELYEENEQLKHDATVLIYSNQEYREENEQLKQQNKELKHDIKFWKLELKEQWNTTDSLSYELHLAIENGYEISDKFKKYLDGLKKKHEEHMKKAERLGI